MEADKKALQSLIALMDDPDDGIYDHVRSKVLEFGPAAIELLEHSWETFDYGLLFQERVEQLIHEIQFDQCKKLLQKWIDSPEKDLIQAASIVASYQYPSLNFEEIREHVQQIKQAVWLEINPHMTAFEKVKVMNKVFFEQLGFAGNTKNYHSPLNSYINTVLETKRGNPLSLSILYSHVAQMLEMPIFGVNLPNNFILAYMDENGTNMYLSEGNEYGVLFYINAFSKGTMFQKTDIIDFLKSIQVTPHPNHFQPCSNTDIIRRMLVNLIAAFQQVGNAEKVEELTLLRDLLDQ